MSINNNYEYNNSTNNSIYTSSIDPSLFKSVTDQAQLNSIIKNMTTDTLDRPIKFAKPKYTDVQKTYEELAPITNKPIEMPSKHSHKVRTTEPVFLQPQIIDENAHMSQILNNNNYDNIPLPTTSVINNLIKDSVMQSTYGSEIQGSNIQNMQNYGIPNTSMKNSNVQNYNNMPNTSMKNTNMQGSNMLNSKMNNSNMQSHITGSKMTKYEQRLRQ